MHLAHLAIHGTRMRIKRHHTGPLPGVSKIGMKKDVASGGGPSFSFIDRVITVRVGGVTPRVMQNIEVRIRFRSRVISREF